MSRWPDFNRKRPVILYVLLFLLLFLPLSVGSVFAQPPGDPMEQGFRNPPESARPRTWWHWTGANITHEGIRKDLEWMKRVGIGGFQLADVSFGLGQTVDQKIQYGTAEWLEAVRHAAAEADRLGLEMAIFASPGWSLTGGPWVKSQQAMKKLVWSETLVEGPKNFSGKLLQPPSDNGPIGNMSRGAARSGGAPDPTFYGDSAVIAYRLPDGEQNLPELQPKVTSHGGPIDAAALLDEDLNSTLTLDAPKDGNPAWIQFEYAHPFTARAFTLAGRSGIPVGRLSAGDDGTHFRTLVTLPGAQLYRQGSVRTFSFPETTARFYRLELTGAPLNPAATMNQTPAQPAAQYVLLEAKLHAGARIHRWEEKAVFSFLFEYQSTAMPEVPAGAAVSHSGTVDLTGKMAADGSLNWEVPSGKWRILRLGYSLTGAKNRPAMPAGTGYEVDKLSPKHVESYFHGYFDPIAQALGPLFGKSLRYVLLDSWEAGYQNWTEDLIGEFRKRRGYDPLPFLPALTGRVVDSASVSDRFLWDFRRTLADLWADYHYGTLTELLRQKGVGVYSEASGVSLEIPEDTLLNKSKVDIPMGEFWMRDLHPRLMYYQDVRGAASASHVYGKNLVAAESFTGGGYESPYALMKTANYWLAQGINRIVFHTSAHQPLDTKPGNTMVGTHIHRNITWAEKAAPFMNYLSRNCFLLQQGKFVADLAYLLDEGAPSTPPMWGAGLVPAPPEGYDYDYVNADVLLKRMSVDKEGRLVLPDGMTYRVMVLPQNSRSMRPELLRKIRDLVAGGATIVGARPMVSPSLQNYPVADEHVEALSSELWGDLDGISRNIRRYEKGWVIWGLPLEQVLAHIGVKKDFESSRPLDSELAWLHRRTEKADIYYVANLTDSRQEIDVRLRTTGREAELWHTDTGEITPAAYSMVGDFTTVKLDLEAQESLFVVFRKETRVLQGKLPPRPQGSTLTMVEGPWDVTFEPNLGGPATSRFPRLESWTLNSDEGIKHYSGTATYTKSIQAPAEWFRPDTRLLLDMGEVLDMADVTLNGKGMGLFWKPPFRFDVTGLLRPGENRLEVKVTNQWTNRLIGDRALAKEKKILGDTRIMVGGMGGGSVPLSESGLLGPVALIVEDRLSPVGDVADGKVADLPANYTEAKVNRYHLPDPLLLVNGKKVAQAKDWTEKRRSEIVRLFEANQYGRTPGRPKDLTFDVFDQGTAAFDGKALRRQVTVYFSGDKAGPKMDLVLYLPPHASQPVPVLLNVGFTANSLMIDDPGIKPGEIWNRQQQRVPAGRGPSFFGRLNVLPFLEKGFGFAAICYGDIDPDFLGGVSKGVRALYLKPGQTEPAADEWGAISAWAWGISRAMDYFETDPGVDAKRIAITGCSRLGKTAMWAGAHDTRIAMVLASCSGEGGAALSRRNYGETIAHLTAPNRFPYQFCANYGKWAADPGQSPVDANLLVALIAPRPLLLQTGDTDRWSDPKGEFLAAIAARPVYELFGKKGPVTDQMPSAGNLVGDTLAYYMHAGGHGMVPSDWDVFLQFMEKHLK